MRCGPHMCTQMHFMATRIRSVKFTNNGLLSRCAILSINVQGPGCELRTCCMAWLDLWICIWITARVLISASNATILKVWKLHWETVVSWESMPLQRFSNPYMMSDNHAKIRILVPDIQYGLDYDIRRKTLIFGRKMKHFTRNMFFFLKMDIQYSNHKKSNSSSKNNVYNLQI